MNMLEKLLLYSNIERVEKTKLLENFMIGPSSQKNSEHKPELV